MNGHFRGTATKTCDLAWNSSSSLSMMNDFWVWLKSHLIAHFLRYFQLLIFLYFSSQKSLGQENTQTDRRRRRTPRHSFLDG